MTFGVGLVWKTLRLTHSFPCWIVSLLDTLLFLGSTVSLTFQALANHMGYQVGSLWWERFSELGIEKEEELRTLKRGRIYTSSRRVSRVTSVTVWETRRKCSRKLQSTCWEELQSPFSSVWGVWAFGSPVRGQVKARFNTLTLTEGWFLIFIYYLFVCQSIFLLYYMFNFFSFVFLQSKMVIFFFYWSIVDLQNAVSITAAQQSDSFYILFHYDYHRMLNPVLCVCCLCLQRMRIWLPLSPWSPLCACVCTMGGRGG